MIIHSPIIISWTNTVILISENSTPWLNKIREITIAISYEADRELRKTFFKIEFFESFKNIELRNISKSRFNETLKVFKVLFPRFSQIFHVPAILPS